MISVLLIWIYMLLTVFPLGYLGLYGLISDKKQINRLIPEDFVMFGLMAVTVYAQFFSLFAGVGLAANIILLAASLTAAVFGFKSFKVSFPERLSFKPVLIIVLLVSTLIMAFGASRGYMHYDSDLYHAQSIHWIEDYGVVKGLGNLHGRLGYNSSSFSLSALYSFGFLGGQSFHACAGFLAYVVFINCLRLFHIFKDRHICVSDFARLGGIYYILNIYDEMVSPESDYFVMLFFIYSVIRLLDLSEIPDADEDLIAFPSLLSVFLVTLKFSSVGMLIVLVLPVILLIKKKRIGKLLVYIGIGFLTVLPFFIRNYLLSGWLLYPTTQIDIFRPVWKVSKEYALADSGFIIAYGRGYTDYHCSAYPFNVWFPNWFNGLGRTETILFFASIVGILFAVVCFFFEKKKTLLHITELSVICTFLLWFFSAPLIRYGQGFLIMMPAVLLGNALSLILINTKKKKPIVFAVLCFFTLFLCYKTFMLIRYTGSIIGQPYYLLQEDYGKYKTREHKIKNFTFYTPLEGDRTGYDAFPSSPDIYDNLDLLGDSVKDGFYLK